jgi:hypothetical protein
MRYLIDLFTFLVLTVELFVLGVFSIGTVLILYALIH